MITRIEALGFKCFHYTSQPVKAFQILVGPNASGKSAFLDILSFLSDILNHGPEKALEMRSNTMNFKDLVWNGKGSAFELAVEASMPDDIRNSLQDYGFIRYEISMGLTDEGRPCILKEQVLLLERNTEGPERSYDLFPAPPDPPRSIFYKKRQRGTRLVVSKVLNGNDNFYSETYRAKGKGWAPSIRLGPQRSALANLPAEEDKFPASTWLKELLASGVHRFVLNSEAMRKPAPYSRGKTFRTDGSNLPWVIKDLIEKSSERFLDWLNHIRTALPEIEALSVTVRPEDSHAYLKVRYSSGLEVPSWGLSDGTLRFLALTLPAYIPKLQGVFLIEEPENGVHPAVMQSIYDSLNSIYEAQVFVATHSPVFLGLAGPVDIMCFARTGEGIDIVRGDQHPILKDWQREVPLSTLFAGGLLG